MFATLPFGSRHDFRTSKTSLEKLWTPLDTYFWCFWDKKRRRNRRFRPPARAEPPDRPVELVGSPVAPAPKRSKAGQDNQLFQTIASKACADARSLGGLVDVRPSTKRGEGSWNTLSGRIMDPGTSKSFFFETTPFRMIQPRHHVDGKTTTHR